MFESARCHKTGKVLKNALWKNVYQETTQVLFDRMNNYTDHLGNIRLRYAKDPEAETGLKILEEDHYYPFGLKHKGYNNEHNIFYPPIGTPNKVVIVPITPDSRDPYKYKYNGKEFQDELGLDWYDYGARNYDASLGRWMNVDPLAENAPDWTPYRYAFNNPLLFIDPDGMFEDNYGLDIDGYITLLKKTEDNFDRLYAVDNEGKIKDNENHVQINKQSSDDSTIITDLSEDDPNFVANSFWGKKVGAWAKTNNKADAYNVFKFGSDNSNVEWSLQEYSGNRFVLGNSHFSETVGNLNSVSGYDILDLKKDYHSHPGTSKIDDRASGQIGDQGYSSGIVWKFLNAGKKDYSTHPTFHIYRPALNKKFQYSPWSKKFNEKKAKTDRGL